MTDYSRPLRLGASATGLAADALEPALRNSTTVVSVEPQLPGALLTARLLLSTLRRLPGQVVLSSDRLADNEIGALSASATAVTGDPLRIDHDQASAIRVHIGTDASARAVRVVPDGYGARIASDASNEIHQSRPANALGAMYAAALGAAEAFKLAAAVPDDRASLHKDLAFCPVTLSDDLGAAPDLPTVLTVNLALIGLGAVGTATALILSELGLEGEVLLVDRERFAPENLATYSLGGHADAERRPWKVDLAATVLKGLSICRTTEPVEHVARLIDDGGLPWPQIVLSGLDSIAARHATQRLWPDLLIDAATGDTLVGIHVAQPRDPCLLCFLPPRHEGPSAAKRLADATGLPIDRAIRGDNPLADDDLASLPEPQQQLLRPHVGKPVCGLADALGLTSLDAGDYQPAIPFAAQQAACLGVGRLVSHLLGASPAANFVQYDALRGPQQATLEKRIGLPGCYCNERAATIDRVRELRSAGRE